LIHFYREEKAAAVKMSDRLTQLQEAVNQQADNMCNSVGILQQNAVASNLNGGLLKQEDQENKNKQEELTQLFATLIARTAKDIEILIDSLPSEESSLELQTEGLRRLEVENDESARDLQSAVAKGENILSKIHAALHDISTQQLEISKIEAQYK